MVFFFFFFKQKTAYEMRISDWSSECALPIYGTIPWVSPKDMKTEEISDAEERITEAGLKGSSTNLVAVDHVLMVVRSGILKHTIPVAINTKPVALNQIGRASCRERVCPYV